VERVASRMCLGCRDNPLRICVAGLTTSVSQSLLLISLKEPSLGERGCEDGCTSLINDRRTWCWAGRLLEWVKVNKKRTGSCRWA